MPGKKSRDISLYFHIPFCTRKCSYCHFYVIPNKEIFQGLLMEGLRSEWELRRAWIADKRVVSVYFGGGTPALMKPERFREILSWIDIAPDCEVTIEANPENINAELASELRETGINRFSVGVQSFDDTLLSDIGRTHDARGATEAIEGISRAGITNISLDLMYDLPGQGLATWKRSIETACSLPISHLSLYNLTIEPHTVFYKHREEIQQQMPCEDSSAQMYEHAIERLNRAGLQQYEISAFAAPGMQSRHNSGYWTGRPFLGFGPSAFSYWEGKRFRNIANLHRYARSEDPVDFEEELDPNAALRELLIIGLRRLEGINLDDFSSLGKEVLDTLYKYTEQGFFRRDKNRIRLSDAGIFVYDALAAELV